LNTSPSVEAYTKASYVQAALVDDALGSPWAGYLDVNGCTPAVTHPRTNYLGIITSSLRAFTTKIDVRKTASSGTEAVNKSYTDTVNSTKTLRLTVANPSLNVTAASTIGMNYNLSGYPNNSTLTILTDTACPMEMNAGCYQDSNNTVFLGTDNLGVMRANRK